MQFYFYLFLNPVGAWHAVKPDRGGWRLMLHWLVLIVLATIPDAVRLVRTGLWQPRFQTVKIFTYEAAFAFGAVNMLMLLAMVFLSAFLVNRSLETFGSSRPFMPAFKLVAYGYTPLLLLYGVAHNPGINAWIPWSTGMVLMAWILYYGVPILLEPFPPQMSGQYLFTLTVMALTSGALRYLTALYLSGEFDLGHSALSHYFPSLK